MLRYCANLKAIRYKSTCFNRIVADKLHCSLTITLLFACNIIYQSWSPPYKVCVPLMSAIPPVMLFPPALVPQMGGDDKSPPCENGLGKTLESLQRRVPMSDIKNFTNNCSLRQHLFALCKYPVIINSE